MEQAGVDSTPLATHLITHRSLLMDRWREHVRRDPTQAGHRLALTDMDLDDHLPSLLDKLAEGLRVEVPHDVEAEGAAHGHQRRVLGYTVPEILWEFRIFRQVLMDCLRDYQRVHRNGVTDEEIDEARERILDVIDRSMTASAQRYTTDTEAERNTAMHALHERTNELAQRTAALEEADRQKNHFLAMLSHELRNPIAPILSATHILKQAHLEPRFERARDIIGRQARYQARLLDDLLEVNRIILGKFTLHKAPVDFLDAIRQAAETCAGALTAKHIDLELTLPAAPVVVHADPTRIVQVVTNLLTNAVKFTPPRGKVWLAVDIEDKTAVLRLRDTGIGIDPHLLPHIFEMFAQADSSLDRASSGLGVGLTLAKHLVEAHGGAIEAHSEGLGKGALFIVRWPVLTSDVPQPDLARVPRSKRIAVVEDNPDARVLLAQVLEAMGFAVLTAQDGEEALRLAEQERLPTYIIDLGLPRINGFEVARRIRQMPASEGALLIALSGYGSPEDKQKAAEAGFDHHLTKPADMEKLERLLDARPRAAAR